MNLSESVKLSTPVFNRIRKYGVERTVTKNGKINCKKLAGWSVVVEHASGVLLDGYVVRKSGTILVGKKHAGKTVNVIPINKEKRLM